MRDNVGSLIIEWIVLQISSLSLSLSLRLFFTYFEHVYELLLFQVLDIPIGERANWLHEDIPQLGYVQLSKFFSQTAYPITLHDCSYSKYNTQSKLKFRSVSELFA